MTRFTVSELFEPPVAKVRGKRPVPLLWGVFEDHRPVAAFASCSRADAYARRLNRLTQPEKAHG